MCANRSRAWGRNTSECQTQILELGGLGRVDPEELVAFAPDDQFEAFSYGSELLSHDGAVRSLVAAQATLHRIREQVEGPWDKVLAWIDAQLKSESQSRLMKLSREAGRAIIHHE